MHKNANIAYTLLSMKQRTLLKEASIQGKALHTGKNVELTLKPAPENHGIVFCRTDLRSRPTLTPLISHVTDLVRNTTIASGHTKIHTIEHILSALSGCGIDNALIELNAAEPPIMDGSARPFIELISQAEPTEQEAERRYFELQQPVFVKSGERSIIALPYDGFKITCTSQDNRGIHTQHLALDIDPDIYVSQIAPARTFTFYEDIEDLLKLGKIKGGSLDSAVVLKGDKVITKEPLRFEDEFVRHKILDIIGDLTLLGLPLKAHIIAVCPGHELNSELTSALRQQYEKEESKVAAKSVEAPSTTVVSAEKTDFKPLNQDPLTSLDIQRIFKLLPHRYPFLMIDRVMSIDLEQGELTAVKNVSINESYFQGHFPTQPVMPGVLQIEAMAQAFGVLIISLLGNPGTIAYFMSCDKVKFRQAVTPGDQLEIRVKLIKNRGNKIAQARGECRVAGKIVSAGDLLFTFNTPSNLRS